MSEVEVFQFPGNGQQVRSVVIDGTPWFVAAHVCSALTLRDTSSALRMVDPEDQRRIRRSDTPQFFGGIAPQVQELALVNESGVYSLIFQSNKPSARTFKRWVTHDVLPAVRREGGYISPAATADQLTLLAARAEVQTRVLRNLDGIVDRAWLEAKARHVAARALGEEPEIDQDRRPLTVGEYLQDQGITGMALRKLSPKFGKRLKSAYIRARRHAPATVPRFVDGALRPVAAYAERDRPLFDQVWTELVGDQA